MCVIIPENLATFGHDQSCFALLTQNSFMHLIIQANLWYYALRLLYALGGVNNADDRSEWHLIGTTRKQKNKTK
jgi:hypothetical protein